MNEEFDVYNEEENLVYGMFGEAEDDYDRVAEFLEYKIKTNFYSDEEYGLYIEFKRNDCWDDETKQSELYLELLDQSEEY